jgi:integrase
MAREVVRADVRDAIVRISARGMPMAAHLLQFIGAAFRWAIDEEVVVELPDGKRTVRPRIERDPTRRVWDDLPKVRAAARHKRKRVLSDEEIARLWHALDQLELCWATMPRIILLCGTRRGETHKARWKDIELEGKAPVWRIPAEHRKGRVKGMIGERRAMDVPLAPLAVQHLRLLSGITGQRERVFVGQGLYVGGVGQELKRVSGLHDVTLHDLRRTCSTGLQRLGCPPHVLSVVLGRSREAGTTHTDDSYLLDRRPAEHREWLCLWAQHVERLIGR